MGIKLSLFTVSWAGAGACFFPFFFSPAKPLAKTEVIGELSKEELDFSIFTPFRHKNAEEVKRRPGNRFITLL